MALQIFPQSQIIHQIISSGANCSKRHRRTFSLSSRFSWMKSSLLKCNVRVSASRSLISIHRQFKSRAFWSISLFAGALRRRRFHERAVDEQFHTCMEDWGKIACLVFFFWSPEFLNRKLVPQPAAKQISPEPRKVTSVSPQKNQECF